MDTHYVKKQEQQRTALDWNSQGYRRRGRLKRTWRRTIEDEIRSTRKSWNEVKGIAGDCNAWKLFMDALCSTRSKRIWWWYTTITFQSVNLHTCLFSSNSCNSFLLFEHLWCCIPSHSRAVSRSCGIRWWSNVQNHRILSCFIGAPRCSLHPELQRWKSQRRVLQQN